RTPPTLLESYNLTLPLGTARPHGERELNNQRSGDRQDAMGTSKAIGPGRPIAASLWPASWSRPAPGPPPSAAPGSAGRRAIGSAQVIPVRPHTFGWCWDGIACEAGVRKRSPP